MSPEDTEESTFISYLFIQEEQVKSWDFFFFIPVLKTENNLMQRTLIVDTVLIIKTIVHSYLSQRLESDHLHLTVPVTASVHYVFYHRVKRIRVRPQKNLKISFKIHFSAITIRMESLKTNKQPPLFGSSPAASNILTLDIVIKVWKEGHPEFPLSHVQPWLLNPRLQSL